MNNQATTYSLSAWNACLLGFPDRALGRIDDAFAIARNADSKAVEELVHNYALNVFPFLDPERKQLRASAENTVALASELGNPFRRAVGEFWVAWCDFVAHDRPEDIARMRRALADFRATGSLTMTPYWLALIAQSQCRLGQRDEALDRINEALALIEDTGERTSEAEVQRIKGECLLANSDMTHAEESWRLAIEVARRQRAKTWELRATMSLARLLRDTNRRDEARAMLADIYHWFTEGFDTRDLIEAKALLGELS
jgi:predicted ATPase